jgi:hypothetical protein
MGSISKNVPEQLIVSAAGHVLAAEVLFMQQGDDLFDGPMALSFHLLTGNALELTLKAAFLALGGDEKFAKLKIGHRLDLAFNSAIEQGYQSEDIDLINIVGLLKDTHSNHYFWYLGVSNEEFSMPVPEYVLSVLRRYIDLVVTLIGPSVFTEVRAAYKSRQS